MAKFEECKSSSLCDCFYLARYIATHCDHFSYDSDLTPLYIIA